MPAFTFAKAMTINCLGTVRMDSYYSVGFFDQKTSLSQVTDGFQALTSRRQKTQTWWVLMSLFIKEKTCE